jgi:nucleoside-diphosphate-sugar epimerase
MRRPDITVAKQQLNWQPRVPLDEGLDEIIKYFRTKLGL